MSNDDSKQLTLFDLIEKIDNNEKTKTARQQLIADIADSATEELAQTVLNCDSTVEVFIDRNLEELVFTGLGLKRGSYHRDEFGFIETNGFQSLLKEKIVRKAISRFEQSVAENVTRLVESVIKHISTKKFADEAKRTYQNAYNRRMYELVNCAPWKSDKRVKDALDSLCEEISLRIKHVTLTQLKAMESAAKK